MARKMHFDIGYFRDRCILSTGCGDRIEEERRANRGNTGCEKWKRLE